MAGATDALDRRIEAPGQAGAADAWILGVHATVPADSQPPGSAGPTANAYRPRAGSDGHRHGTGAVPAAV